MYAPGAVMRQPVFLYSMVSATVRGRPSATSLSKKGESVTDVPPQPVRKWLSLLITIDPVTVAVFRLTVNFFKSELAVKVTSLFPHTPNVWRPLVDVGPTEEALNWNDCAKRSPSWSKPLISTEYRGVFEVPNWNVLPKCSVVYKSLALLHVELLNTYRAS